jgi:hypothetical protein
MPNRSGIVCPTASVFSSKAQTNKPDTQSALTNEAARAGAHTETTRRCSKDLSADQRGVRGFVAFWLSEAMQNCWLPVRSPDSSSAAIYAEAGYESRLVTVNCSYQNVFSLCGTTKGDPADVAQA